MIKDQTILVTGGNGFLGKHLVPKLVERQPKCILTPHRCECDFTDQKATINYFTKHQPEIVIHLAAEVGGIYANQQNPGRFFYANAMMGLNLIESARLISISKFVQVGTVCAYPKFTKVPFKETDLWNGYPEETNAPYGVAKRSLQTMLQAYREQYKLNGIYLVPVNLYGPNDNFDLHTSHVIPAMIRKVSEAKKTGEPLIFWGSGKASREFLYVDDCAEAIVRATEQFNQSSEPVNIGTGEEIKIKDLAKLICKKVGYKGKIFWDRSKPDGQPRRCLDVSLAWKRFRFRAKTSLDEGLSKTIQWYSSPCRG